MKKVLAFVLVAVLAVGMAVPVTANHALNASVENTLPVLTENMGKTIRFHTPEEASELSEEIQNLMAEAEEALKDVDSKGLALRYFFYTEVLSGVKSVSVDFEPIPQKEMLFMQYIDGMWVTLEHSVGDDKVITVPVVADGPFAIFTDPLASPGARWVDLLPVVTDKSYLSVQLHTVEEVMTLSEEIQNRMAEAKDHLTDACPNGFAVKYFFEMEILGADSVVSVDFEPIEHSEIAFKQFVNGAWVELESSITASGIITVSGLVNGPVATFTK